MMGLGIFIGIIILAAMIFAALSKKSSFRVRVATLIALTLMILTVIICVIIIFAGGTPVDESIVHVIPPAVQEPVDHTNTFITLLLVFIMLAILAAVVYVSLKEHRKTLIPAKEKPKGRGRIRDRELQDDEISDLL